MQPIRVPTVLRERLGEEASAELLEMFHSVTRASTEDAIDRASERFERRLAEELSKFRVEMAHEFSALRAELTDRLTGNQTSLLRWMWVFWTGQVVALAAIIGFVR